MRERSEIEGVRGRREGRGIHSFFFYYISFRL